MNEQVIIEIGTNSIKELHAKRSQDGWQVLSDRTHPTRLGQGFSLTGAISPESAETSLQVIADIIQSFASIKVNVIHIIATESLRSPSNADEFISEVRNRFGLDIVILSGKEEAQLAYLAGTYGRETTKENIAVLDIGGGSTELAVGLDKQIQYWKSLPIGAVNLTERFLKNDIPATAETEALCQEIRSHLQQLDSATDITSLVGVGGTITTLAMLQIPDLERIDGLRLNLEYIREQAQKLSRFSLEQRRKLEGMPWRRAEIIIAGTLILQEFMTHLGMQDITVSVRGVRHGYLYARC